MTDARVARHAGRPPHHRTLVPADVVDAERSLVRFVLLECALSVPFWGLGALAQARIIPDHVLFRASWSLTPMMAAAILVYRETGIAGVQELLRRIVDYAHTPRNPRQTRCCSGVLRGTSVLREVVDGECVGAATRRILELIRELEAEGLL